jgi:hypothetical protein
MVLVKTAQELYNAFAHLNILYCTAKSPEALNGKEH